MIPILGRVANFKDYLPNVLLGAHRVGWWGTSNHSHPGLEGYVSADPKNCDAEIATLKKYGVDWVNHLWHGPLSPFHHSALEMQVACERAGIGFNLCLGSKVGGTTQSYIDALNYAVATFFNSPAYLRDGGRPVVKFFGPPPTIDFTAVRAGVLPGVAPLFIFEGYNRAEADGAFGWVRPQPSPDDFGLTRLLQFRDQSVVAVGKLAFYPIFGKFYDPNPKDPTKSVWDITQPVRKLSPQDGIVALMTAKLVPATAKYAMIATADDAEEGTWMLKSQGILD